MGYEEEKHPTGPVLPEPARSMVSPIDESGQPAPTPSEVPSGLQAYDMKRLVPLTIVVVGILGLLLLNFLNIQILPDAARESDKPTEFAESVIVSTSSTSLNVQASSTPSEDVPAFYVPEGSDED